jgi:hypothetical protein
LRQRSELPRDNRATYKRDKFAPPHRFAPRQDLLVPFEVITFPQRDN